MFSGSEAGRAFSVYARLIKINFTGDHSVPDLLTSLAHRHESDGV